MTSSEQFFVPASASPSTYTSEPLISSLLYPELPEVPVEAHTDSINAYPLDLLSQSADADQLEVPAPTDPLTHTYSFKIPISSNGQSASINIEVELAHRPQICTDSSTENWIESSVLKTLEHHFAHNLEQMMFTVKGDAYVMCETSIPFQENVGKHVTEIDTVTIKIPFTCISQPVHGQSGDGIDYDATVSVFYQSRTDAALDRQAVAVLDGATRDLNVWHALPLSNLIETFNERSQFEQDNFRQQPGPHHLNLQIYRNIIVLKTTYTMNPSVIKCLEHAFHMRQLSNDGTQTMWFTSVLGITGGLIYSRAMRAYRKCFTIRPNIIGISGLTCVPEIDHCQALVANKHTVFGRAAKKGLIWCGVGIGSVWLLRHGLVDSKMQRVMITVGMSFLVGPLGIFAGILARS